MIINGLPPDSDPLSPLLRRVRGRLGAAVRSGDWSTLADLRWQLKGLEVELQQANQVELSHVVQQVALLIELADGFATTAPEPVEEIATLAMRGLATVASMLSGEMAAGDLEAFGIEADRRWGAYLELLGPKGDASNDSSEWIPVVNFDQPQDEIPAQDVRDDEGSPPAEAAIAALRSLFDDDLESDEQAEADRNRLTRLLGGPSSVGPVATDHPGAGSVEIEPDAGVAPLPPGSVFSASELSEIEATFRVEVANLLERIARLIDYLEQPGSSQPAASRELGLCLHSLKGAAGSAGLTHISDLVHNLEDLHEGMSVDGTERPPVGFMAALHELLQVVEGLIRPAEVRRLAERVRVKSDSPPSARTQPESETPGASPVDTEGNVRVPTARLTEFVDLCAELLRHNETRTAGADEASELAARLPSCRDHLLASLDRLQDLQAQMRRTDPNRARPTGASGHDEVVAGLIRDLSAQVEELSELTGLARSAAVQATRSADAASADSRRLWELLHEIRSVPVRTLLRRLERVAVAAAQTEHKQVEVELLGAEHTLDRLVQDRLFEPLLHVVRNAIGHGIESSEARVYAGKPPAGHLTIQAVRDGETFLLIFRDDGGGFDHVAIQAKARKLGLIGPEENPPPDRLEMLLFQPGFTTREGAGAIAGRGLGMSVVLEQVTRLHGTVQLQSEPGVGTTVIVRLPAQLSLQPAMVFRADDQLFAIRLSAVETAIGAGHVSVQDRTASSLESRETILPLRQALGFPPAPPGSKMNILRVRAGDRRYRIAVDSIEGPRELVIRPLHPLLALDPLVAGTSVSLGEDIILLLDPSALVAAHPVEHPIPTVSAGQAVLLVDDSAIARRTVASQFRDLGLDVDEATSGPEVLERVRSRPYRLVMISLDAPGWDGLGLLGELGRLDFPRRPSVIVTSSRLDASVRRRALEMGATAFLLKPIAVEDLAELIGPRLRPGAV